MPVWCSYHLDLCQVNTIALHCPDICEALSKVSQWKCRWCSVLLSMLTEVYGGLIMYCGICQGETCGSASNLLLSWNGHSGPKEWESVWICKWCCRAIIWMSLDIVCMCVSVNPIQLNSVEFSWTWAELFVPWSLITHLVCEMSPSVTPAGTLTLQTNTTTLRGSKWPKQLLQTYLSTQ